MLADPQMGSSVHVELPDDDSARFRELAKRAIAATIFYSGAMRLVEGISRSYELQRNIDGGQSIRRTTQSKSAILCYHRVGIGGVPLFSELDPAVFEAQMRFLRSRYRIVSLDQLCDDLENPRAAGQSVAITFDDGYADLFHHAFPVLQKYKIPASIFLPIVAIDTGLAPWYDRNFLALKVFAGDRFDITLDRPRSFALPTYAARIRTASKINEFLRTLPVPERARRCAEIESRVQLPEDELDGRMLTWDQVRTMHRAGIEFGSHTLTHPAINHLTDVEMIHELVDSKRILEGRLDDSVRHFAFPFGKESDCGRKASPILAQAGYRSASTTVVGVNSPGQNLMALRRSSFCDDPFLPMFVWKLNRLFMHESKDGYLRDCVVPSITAGDNTAQGHRSTHPIETHRAGAPDA